MGEKGTRGRRDDDSSFPGKGGGGKKLDGTKRKIFPVLNKDTKETGYYGKSRH